GIHRGGHETGARRMLHIQHFDHMVTVAAMRGEIALASHRVSFREARKALASVTIARNSASRSRPRRSATTSQAATALALAAGIDGGVPVGWCRKPSSTIAASA